MCKPRNAMTLQPEKKQALIGQYKIHEKDTGSAEVQIALLSERISQLNQHFTQHVKDHSSRRGLLMMVGQRRKLLGYLKRTNQERYQRVLEGLGIRK